MSITAQSVIRRVIDTLQDNTSIRWPVPELVRYLNDGQREVVLYRPDAMVTHTTLQCVAGARQAIPANGSKLIEVVRNAAPSSSRAAIRATNREVLDAQLPGWHNFPGTAEILHYTYDPRDPTAFFVYPPASAAAQVDLVYSAYPTDVPEPADGSTFEAVTGEISLPDIYGNVLQDYILARCYMKDSEYAGNAQRAQAHYTLFANALGIEIKATVAVAPRTTGAAARTVPQA